MDIQSDMFSFLDIIFRWPMNDVEFWSGIFGYHFPIICMTIGVKCRQYYVLFSDSHQIMSRSEPESSDFIFLCLLILYFNHFAHYFPIFVDLESIEISFHNHITLLFTINFIQSLTHPEMSLLVYPLYFYAY